MSKNVSKTICGRRLRYFVIVFNQAELFSELLYVIAGATASSDKRSTDHNERCGVWLLLNKRNTTLQDVLLLANNNCRVVTGTPIISPRHPGIDYFSYHMTIPIVLSLT